MSDTPHWAEAAVRREPAPVRVVRETHLSRAPAPGSGGVALASLVALAAVSLLYWTDPLGLGDYLPASGQTLFGEGEYWRAFTTNLTHADTLHLAANALPFGALSYLIYGYFGPLAHPVGTLAAGALVTVAVLGTYPPDVQLVGASGLVYLMAAAWLTLFLLIERRLSLGQRLLRATGFGLVLLAPTALEPLVSHRTHAAGFVAGVAFGAVLFTLRRQGLRRAERVEWQ